MKHLLIILLFFASLFAVTESANGSKKLYVHTVKKILGSAQSLDGAKYSAVESAKLEILEYAGTYMQTQTKIVDGSLTEDEILAIASGVIKTEVIDENKSFEGDAIAIAVTVQCELETDGLEKRIEKLLANKELKKQNEDLLEKNRELLAEIAKLQEKSKNITTEKEKKNLEEEFRNTDKKAQAIKYFEESLEYASLDLTKFTNSQKVIELLTKAIELDPSLASAYYNRGFAYSDTENYAQAIKGFSKAIELDPSYAAAYNNRGFAYYKIQNYAQAIKDFSKAIELDPSDVMAYYNRGFAYDDIQNYTQAIKDYSKAIKLDTSNTNAYYNRGIAYILSGNYNNGCQDANVACRLGNCGLVNIVRKNGYCQ